jgi:hypothetical protein
MARYDVETVEKKYKVKLPARVKSFIAKELAGYKGATLAKPITGDELAEYKTVVFGSASLFDSNMFDRKRYPTKVPLAALADASGGWRLELFVLECSGPKLGAVYFGKTGAGYGGPEAPDPRVVAPSLDTFLAMLDKPTAKPTAKPAAKPTAKSAAAIKR